MADKLLYYFTPVGKLLLFLLFVFVAFIPIALLIQVPAVLNLLHLLQPVYQEVIQDFIFIAVIATALTMLFRVFPQYNWQQIFIRDGVWLSGLLKGILIGTGIMAACALILYGMGNVQFSYNGFIPQYIYPTLLLFIVVAVFEELLFRSFPLIVFAERYPLMLTLLINGLLFACAHLANPNFNALAFVNIALAGCLFSLLILLKWNITWAVGIHLGWNFTQGALLGYNVSGLDIKGVLIAKPVGNIYLAGGSFGLEGSVICTAILLITLLFIFIKYKIHPLLVVEEHEITEVGDEPS